MRGKNGYGLMDENGREQVWEGIVGKNGYGGWARMGENKYGKVVGKNGYVGWARMGEKGWL